MEALRSVPDRKPFQHSRRSATHATVNIGFSDCGPAPASDALRSVPDRKTFPYSR